MIKLELNEDQLQMLLRHGLAHCDVDAAVRVYRDDTVQAGERLCHVRAVTDNPHWPTKTVYLTMGCGL